MAKKEENNKKNKQFGNVPNSKYINLPRLFRKDYLAVSNSAEIINFPILALRIIFKILNNVSYRQFRSSNLSQQQLMLDFNSDFLLEDNSVARFTFPIKDIDKNRNNKRVKEALDVLELHQRSWHKVINKKGKEVSFLGGFIKDSFISEGEISFLMTGYWLSQIVNLGHYNSVGFNLAFKVSNTTQFFFYLYLNELPTGEGKITVDNFQKLYGYNYKNTNSLVTSVLRPMRRLFDENMEYSFNYSSANGVLHFKRYTTKNKEKHLKAAKKETTIKREITRKLSYWKSRHKLTTENIALFKDLIKKDDGCYPLLISGYDVFLSYCKEKELVVVDVIGDDFLTKFQKAITQHYKTTAFAYSIPNGYPRVI